MGKQKYAATGGGTTNDGERKQRNHTKSGKLAKRQETRRLEAIERQVVNIQKLEAALKKAEDKTEAQKALTKAQFTLQVIRGGVPHKELRQRFETPKQDENTPSQQEGAQPSKKNGKPSRPSKGGTTPAPSSI